jgi:hypothetical protein
MRRLAVVLALILVCGPGPALGQSGSGSNSTRPLDVLIIGNSYTYFNNLGDVLAGIAASLPEGPDIRPTLMVGGGMTLQWHYATGQPTEALRRQRWDFVVLQEQSALGGGSEGGEAQLSPPTIFHTSVRRLVPEIRAAGATPLMLMTWARREHPDEQAALTAAYMTIARELNVRVAAAGLAWQEVRRRWPEVELHVADGSHPGPAGTYLTALVLYEAIAGRKADGAAAHIAGHPYSRRDGRVDRSQTVPLVSLSAELAARLQDAAASIRR